MMTREKVTEAMRIMRQLASDPNLKKAFKSDERKILNDAANVLRDHTESFEPRREIA